MAAEDRQCEEFWPALTAAVLFLVLNFTNIAVSDAATIEYRVLTSMTAIGAAIRRISTSH